MEPGGELLYRDRRGMSLHVAKIYAWLILSAFLLIMVLLVFYDLADLGVFWWFVIVLSFCLVALLLSYSPEIWLSDGYLYCKKELFNFIKPRRISIEDVIETSNQPTFNRNRMGEVVVILTLKNGEEVEFVKLKSHKQSIELEEIIRSRLPGRVERAHGEEYLKNGEYKQAIHEFDRSIAANPDNYHTFSLRSWAKESDRDLQGALKDMNQAVILAPNEGMLYMQRSFLHNQLEMWEEARVDLEKHAELLPSVTTHPNFLAYKQELKQKTGRG